MFSGDGAAIVVISASDAADRCLARARSGGLEVIWYLLIAASLLIGLLSRRWWTFVVIPTVALALGLFIDITEPASYDMQGIGFYVGAAVAILALAAWLLGRLARNLSRRHAR
jgi:hypothetical protein